MLYFFYHKSLWKYFKFSCLVQSMKIKKWVLLLSVCLLSCCQVHRPLNPLLPVETPCLYTHEFTEGEVEKPRDWWTAFGSPNLNHVVDCALSGNLELKEGWWRVIEALWQTRVVGSLIQPQINNIATVSHIRTSNPSEISGVNVPGSGVEESAPAGKDSFTIYSLSTLLTYEVDIWRRIRSLIKSSCLELKATREDLEAVAWMISGRAVDLWLTIQEQKTLLKVVDYQIDVSKTLLELIELRFGVGLSTSLEIYQQRLQLASAEEERIPIETQYQTVLNELYVLTGLPPGGCDLTDEGGLMDLPSFPCIGTPYLLLCNRPDLRAIFRRIMAADYQVAAAIAERLPRLELEIGYDFSAMKLKDLFQEQMSQILGSLVTPLFDGGRRRAEVARRKAVVCQLLQEYGQLFLNALLEVENTLVQEKQQLKLLDQLKYEVDLAQKNLEESRIHYIYGLNDYLSVIAATQSLQNLQRREVAEKKRLLLNRAVLYRKLGGDYL